MSKIYISIVLLLLISQKVFTQASFTYQGNLCKGNTINFTHDEIVETSSWLWDFGDGDTSIDKSPSHLYLDSGSYTVKLSIVIKSNNNTKSSTKEIHISENPKVYFTVDSTPVYFSTYSRIFIDSSITNNPISSYIWSFGDNTSSIKVDTSSIMYKYREEGAYEVTLKVVDSEGCVDSASNTVNIYDRYYVPNVFTPNGDLLNDQFIVTSNGETLFSIEIYSRWGNIVFKRSGHEQIVWDGRMPEGSMVKPGTYYYVISSESGDITYEPEKGYITVYY